uniref:Uncharacterized protein n=1 Tax=Palpitomonas bilix TaxID=652834 RepID=A0A7S3GLX3_9EUKA
MDNVGDDGEEERQGEVTTTSNEDQNKRGPGEGLCQLWTSATDDDLVREFFFADVDGQEKRLPSGSAKSVGDVARTLSFAKVQLRERVIALDKREADLSRFEADLKNREAKLRESAVSQAEIRKKIELSKKLAADNAKLSNELKEERMRATPEVLNAEITKLRQQCEKLQKNMDVEKGKAATLKQELDALKVKKAGEGQGGGAPRPSEAAHEKMIEKLEKRVTTLQQKMNDEIALKKKAIEELAAVKKEKEKLELRVERLQGMLDKEKLKVSNMTKAMDTAVRRQSSFGKDLSAIDELTKQASKAREEAEVFIQRSKERTSRENSTSKPPRASTTTKKSGNGEEKGGGSGEFANAMGVETAAGEEAGPPPSSAPDKKGGVAGPERLYPGKPVEKAVKKKENNPLKSIKMLSGEEQLFRNFQH